MGNQNANGYGLTRCSKQILKYMLFGYTGFIFFWWLSQWMSQPGMVGWTFLSVLTFHFILMAFWGIAVPIVMAKQFYFKLHSNVSSLRLVNGLAILLIIFIEAVFRSGVYESLVGNAPQFLVSLKYILLFLPFTLGITLHCFFFIPRSIERVMGKTFVGQVTAVLVSSAALGFAFLVDSLFTDFSFALEMFFLGIFIGSASVLTRSIYFAFPVFFLILLGKTIVTADYHHAPWGPVIIGFLVAGAALIISWRYLKRRAAA